MRQDHIYRISTFKCLSQRYCRYLWSYNTQWKWSQLLWLPQTFQIRCKDYVESIRRCKLHLCGLIRHHCKTVTGWFPELYSWSIQSVHQTHARCSQYWLRTSGHPSTWPYLRDWLFANRPGELVWCNLLLVKTIQAVFLLLCATRRRQGKASPRSCSKAQSRPLFQATLNCVERQL